MFGSKEYQTNVYLNIFLGGTYTFFYLNVKLEKKNLDIHYVYIITRKITKIKNRKEKTENYKNFNFKMQNNRLFTIYAALVFP